MEVSKKYFNQLNPSYQVVIKNLEKKLEHECSSKAAELILAFATTYLVPKKYWRTVLWNNELSNQNAWKAFYHFYYDEGRNNRSQSKDNFCRINKTLEFMFAWVLYEVQNHYKFGKRDLRFPHSYLNRVFYEIESEANRALPKDFVLLYETNKEYYARLKQVENDIDRWLKILCEAAAANNDDEIVTHNIEYRLGSNLLDTKLWKLYIEYLREHDPKEMLQVYSKYCRFFLDDSEMKEKYKQEVEKYGPVYVPWKNTFDFECHEEGQSESKNKKLVDEGKEFCDDNNKGIVSDVDNKKLSYPLRSTEPPVNGKSDIQPIDMPELYRKFYDIYQVQNFSFKSPFMSYILENADYKILKKLQQSCKYFFC